MISEICCRLSRVYRLDFWKWKFTEIVRFDIIFSYKLYIFYQVCTSDKMIKFANCFTWHNLVQKCKIRLVNIGQIFLLENLSWFKVGHALNFFSDSFCVRLCLKSFWREILREAIFNFLPKLLSGQSLCKFSQIFPPKVLVYIGEFFDDTLINLILFDLTN